MYLCRVWKSIRTPRRRAPRLRSPKATEKTRAPSGAPSLTTVTPLAPRSPGKPANCWGSWSRAGNWEWASHRRRRDGRRRRKRRRNRRKAAEARRWREDDANRVSRRRRPSKKAAGGTSSVRRTKWMEKQIICRISRETIRGAICRLSRRKVGREWLEELICRVQIAVRKRRRFGGETIKEKWFATLAVCISNCTEWTDLTRWDEIPFTRDAEDPKLPNPETKKNRLLGVYVVRLFYSRLKSYRITFPSFSYRSEENIQWQQVWYQWYVGGTSETTATSPGHGTARAQEHELS